MTLTMRKVGSWLAAFFLVFLMFAHVDAEARRMGGGGSVGRQSSNVTQRQAATPPAAQRNSAATNNAQTRQRSPMMGMLGGLAAGLGLAWLASSLGLGEEFGSIMLMMLIGMVVLAVVAAIMRSRNRAAMQGAGQGNPFMGAAAGGAQPAQRSYNPDHAGAGGGAQAFPQAQGGSMIGSALAGSQNWGIPQGFDTEGFLSAAKRNFVSLQKAWDEKDLIALRAMMTDQMLAEIRQQLAERDAASGGKPNKTEVVTLDAQLLGIEEFEKDYMASVEFSGTIREDAAGQANPFREVWNMTKAKDGSSGWLVAGLQALE